MSAKKPPKPKQANGPAPAPKAFDPNLAATDGSGVFGLPFSIEQAQVVLLPVPFDATTSYGGGASAGPDAVVEASKQVDLLDHQFGEVYKVGIAMLDEPAKLRKLSRKARRLAAPIIEAGGVENVSVKVGKNLAKVNAASEKMNALVEAQTRRLLAAGKVPGLLGGDHSTPLGAIAACAHFAGKGGLGILHIDAHMDLRRAFEGFTCSHASIMFNVLKRVPGVTRIVQVGIRDYCPAEREVVRT